MADTISNKCKECKWFDGRRCTEPERNRVNKEKGWDYYRNFRRMPHEPACKRFKEKENDMLNDENLKDFQAVLDSASKTLDSIECVLDRELEIRGEEIKVEPKIPINRYGLGQTLYLPVKIVGIRSRKTPNGCNIVLYELSTASDQRIGFKIFEHANDIWSDKDRYLVSLPEEYLRDHFKEGD